MKITFFDQEDLDIIGKMIRTEMVRALRIAASEGLFTGIKTEPRKDAPSSPKVEIPPSIVHPPHKPETGPVTLKGEPAEKQPAFVPTEKAVWPPEAIKEDKKKRRSIRDIAKVQIDRPFGYITTDEATKVMRTLDATKATALINHWAVSKQIPSVIVTSVKPPTKGLPGRLMVDKAALIKRDQTRISNAAVPPSQRKLA